MLGAFQIVGSLLGLSILLVTVGCTKGSQQSATDASIEAPTEANAVPSITINGIVQLAPVKNESVRAYKLNADGTIDSAVVAETTTQDDGSFTLRVPEGTGPLVIKTLGEGTHLDEALQTEKSACVLGAVVDPAQSTQVPVTPVSTLAQARAQELMGASGKTFEEAKSQAESEVASKFDMEASDLLELPVSPYAIATMSGEEKTEKAKSIKVARRLAILSYFVKDFSLQGLAEAEKLATVIEALQADFKDDGKFNGSVSGSLSLASKKLAMVWESAMSAARSALLDPNSPLVFKDIPEAINSFSTGSALSGWVPAEQLYYLSGVQTSLDQNGEGLFFDQYYYLGELANGQMSDGKYYSSGLLASSCGDTGCYVDGLRIGSFLGCGYDICVEVDRFGSSDPNVFDFSRLDGSDFAVFAGWNYLFPEGALVSGISSAGSTFIAFSGVGGFSGFAKGNFYVSGYPTTLDANGTGFWDGRFFYQGTQYGLGDSSNLQITQTLPNGFNYVAPGNVMLVVDLCAGCSLSSSGIVDFAGVSNNGTVTASYVSFQGLSSNNGLVIGNASFSGNGYYANNTGTINGDASFNNENYNSGTVTGVATFAENAVNWGGIVDVATAVWNGLNGCNAWGCFIGGRPLDNGGNGLNSWNGNFYVNGVISVAISGCMDSLACNYNPSANNDDSSCSYTCAEGENIRVYAPESDGDHAVADSTLMPGNYAWISYRYISYIQKRDITTGEFISNIELPGNGGSAMLFRVGEYVWAFRTWGDSGAWRVHRATDAVTTFTESFPIVKTGASSDGFIWLLGVHAGPKLYKVDGNTGEIVVTRDLSDIFGAFPEGEIPWDWWRYGPQGIAVDSNKIAITGDSKLVFFDKNTLSVIRTKDLPSNSAGLDPAQAYRVLEGQGGWFVATGGDGSTFYRYDYATDTGRFLDVVIDSIEGVARDATGFWIPNTHSYVQAPYLYHIKFDGTIDRRLDMSVYYGFGPGWSGAVYPKTHIAPGGRVWQINYYPFRLLIMDWMSDGSSPAGACGDFLCDSGETNLSCSADCP
ncbi:hypothetical protein EBQ90_00700 [bacterium]|nr:hypothetical protein [bacterium]